ncbi:hypothetical protein VKT23_002889 [Stygiomarasmius scandens]|uniref:Vps72/YL1 C-terminal domain-containing protein n=1 Tax=Marasmiellus scandens TaxID=2682957 RepID=A0ABR1JX03_9AGAR
MEAALAEMALEEQNKDPDDDKDFVVEKFEEDAFESDFESTDEEAAQEEAEGGEKEVQDAERKEKRAAKTRLERATAAAHERQKVTFDPTSISATTKSKKTKARRRVSLGLAINAETGEVIEVPPQDGNEEAGAGPRRKSKRGSTRLNTTETVKRMLQSEEKKAQAPKKTKTSIRSLTQGELIARALDNEEGNIVEHRDYLLLEEEKRKKARVVRESVTGPLVRWISRIEEVEIAEEPTPTTTTSNQTPTPTQGQIPYMYGYPYYTTHTQQVGSTSYGQYGYPYYSYQATGSQLQPAQSSSSTLAQTPEQSASTSSPAPAPTATTSTPTTSAQNQSSSSSSTSTAAPPPASVSTSTSTGAPTPLTPTPSSYNPYLTYSHTSQLLAFLQQQQQGSSSTSSSTQPAPSSSPSSTQTQPQVQLPPHLAHLQHLVPQIQQFYAQLQTQSWGSQSASTTTTTTAGPGTPTTGTLTTAAVPLEKPKPKTEHVTKNYVIHELGQHPDAPKPGWKETMEDVFGNYQMFTSERSQGEEVEKVDWENMKVYSGKVRPLSRPTQTCPITGLPAKYLDPRTGVPFADVRAFKVLTGLMRHEYVWEGGLGCFVGCKAEEGQGGDMDVDA